MVLVPNTTRQAPVAFTVVWCVVKARCSQAAVAFTMVLVPENTVKASGRFFHHGHTVKASDGKQRCLPCGVGAKTHGGGDRALPSP